MNPNIAGCLFGGLIVFVISLFFECKLDKKTLRSGIQRSLLVAVVGTGIGYALFLIFPPPV